MEILFALVAFLLFFVFMAVGVMFKRPALKGSCGGIATLMNTGKCTLCGGDPNRCEEIKQTEAGASDLAYDASKKQ